MVNGCRCQSLSYDHISDISLAMLSALAHGKIKSKFLLLIDSLAHQGQDLFLALVKGISDTSGDPVHMLCFEHSCEYYKSHFKDVEDIHFHDCISDPAGWNGNGKISSLQSQLKNSPHTDIVLVIDSLSSMFFTLGYGPGLKELAKLRKDPLLFNGIFANSIICLVHSDAILDASSVVKQLEHLATTCVDLRQGLASILHSKQGKSVERKEERYVLSDGKVRVCKEAAKTSKQYVPESSMNPQDVASFRVELGPQEKEARRKIVLPFLKTKQQNKEMQQGTGKVFYQPDEADDWDDEDPDDDLDV